MKPASILNAAGISSARLASALPGIDLDRVTLRPAPHWLSRVWGKQIRALALPRAIYVRADVLGSDSRRLGELVVHELVHVHQWSSAGVVAFLWRYANDYLRGRLRGWSHVRAYRAISQEVEARDLARSIIDF